MTTERFSASNAARLMTCAGSGNLEESIPGWTPPVVDHEAGAKGHGTNIHAMLEPIAQLGARDLQHVIAALQYFESIRSKRRFKILTEYTFVLDFLHQKPKTTVDVVLFLNDELHVFDWKTGKIPVDVHGNHQLRTYALAAAQELAPQAKGVHIHVVQPWADNMESEYVTAEELAQHLHDMLETDKKLQAKDTTLVPSDHCKFCPANPQSRGDKGHPYCPAMMQMLYPRSGPDEEAMLSDLE